MSANGRAPKGWIREWINDDCHCEALFVYDWRPNGDASWTPVLKRFLFQRALFCGTDHEAEIRSADRTLSDDGLPFPDLFQIKGNSETPQG